MGGLDLNQMGVYQCTPVHFELNQAHLTFKSVHDDHLKEKWLQKLKKKTLQIAKDWFRNHRFVEMCKKNNENEQRREK